MTQILTIENTIQKIINFSNAESGDFFIYSNQVCIKLNNNNPNYAILDTGEVGKLNSTDQIIFPVSILIKLE